MALFDTVSRTSHKLHLHAGPELGLGVEVVQHPKQRLATITGHSASKSRRCVARFDFYHLDVARMKGRDFGWSQETERVVFLVRAHGR